MRDLGCAAMSQDVRIITGQDLIWQLRSMKRSLLRSGLIGALLAFMLIFYRGVYYTVEATFQEQSELEGGEGRSMMKQLFSGLPPSTSQIQPLLQSHSILRPVVEMLGLQARVLPDRLSFFCHRLEDLWCAEWGLGLKDPEELQFSHVSIDIEKPIDMFFSFTGPESFELFYQGEKIAIGSIGIPFTAETCAFSLRCTLQKAPKEAKRYQVRFSPWLTLVKKLQKNIAVLPHKINGSIYRLIYQTRDRKQGVQLLSKLMAELQRYFHQEHEAFAKEQLTYLGLRQKELFQQFEETIRGQAALMQESLAGEGCFDAEQQLQLVLDPYLKLKEKALAIDFELQRLQSGCLVLEDPALSDLQAQMWSLQQQKDLLEASPLSLPYQAIVNNYEIQGSKQQLMDQHSSSQWEGADWDTIKHLRKEYTHLLDQARMRLRVFEDALEQMEGDLGSLITCLKDPISQQFISSASSLQNRLKEEIYCSEKERLRWKEELALQRRLLKEHIEQTALIERAEVSRLLEQLRALQQAGQSSIHRQLSVIERSKQEQMAKRRSELLQERELVSDQMGSLRSQLSLLPETWQAEQRFELQSKANLAVIKTAIELIETKTIGHHLHKVGSKPLDQPALPLLPEFPYGALAMLVGALALSGSRFFVSVLQKGVQGFPVTPDKLRMLSLPFSGELHSLDTLRHVCVFVDASPKTKVLGILGGKGPDFSFSLASLFVRAGRKVCIVHPLSQPSREGVDYFSYGSEWPQSHLFLEPLKMRYELIILFIAGALDKPEAMAALQFCDKIIVSLRGESIDLLTPFISWAYDKEYRRLTFVASRPYL